MSNGTVLPANLNILEDNDDLVQLSFLNEPSVLHNLCCRYSQSTSYTKAGPVLLAMNPFKGVEVRGNELVSGCGKKPRVSPRIYYWAKDAFIAMMNNYSRSILGFAPVNFGLEELYVYALSNVAYLAKKRVDLDALNIYDILKPGYHSLEAVATSSTILDA
ncbi:hypothetical protein Syun_028325 [Stephania yunnanensis]|uniref:Myosin motor domain-containing protein n=1 Tax=Stephania yunnanensis TaxID=152371 RepID=A0AAP0ER31_9MAGN